jgi:hypothetical protein
MTNLPSAIASKFAGTGLKAGQNLAESYGYAPSAENKAYVQDFNYPNYIPRVTELPTKEEEAAAGKAEDVGRKPLRFERLPKGVPVGAKRTGKTPDGKDVFELNGKKYVGE